MSKANSFENVIDNAFKQVKESKKKVGILPIAKSNILDSDDSITSEWVV